MNMIVAVVDRISALAARGLCAVYGHRWEEEDVLDGCVLVCLDCPATRDYPTRVPTPFTPAGHAAITGELVRLTLGGRGDRPELRAL